VRPLPCGLETEYGLLIEGRGPDTQLEDAAELVRSYPGEFFAGWDYRFESPRADLRGFSLERLAFDPDDARFDTATPRTPEQELRSDAVLPNGARFYNDHGHPEYATPECWSLKELVLHDLAGELAARRAAEAYSQRTGRRVRLYKNNTDFHGASYGAHESYLAPRSLGFDRLYRAVTPILIARQVLCGAGKVGSEAGPAIDFQLSQRSDFLVDSASAETLYRRPVFNTRDEPHADPAQWIRLHVIAGDSNLSPSCVYRRAGLVRLAVALECLGEAPCWNIGDPVAAFHQVSRGESSGFRIELGSGNRTTARHILESYFAAAEASSELEDTLGGSEAIEETRELIAACRTLLDDFESDRKRFERSVDWAAKKALIDSYRESEGLRWSDEALKSLDLEYHNLDATEGLYFALEEAGEVDARPSMDLIGSRLAQCRELSRAYARGSAVRLHSSSLKGVSWAVLSFQEGNGQLQEVWLDPTREFSEELGRATDVSSFVSWIRG
jgi:hypothetical protein